MLHPKSGHAKHRKQLVAEWLWLSLSTRWSRQCRGHMQSTIKSPSVVLRHPKLLLRVIVIATGPSDKILSTRIWAFALTLISTTDSTIAHEQKLGQHIYYTIFYLVVLARLDTTQVSLLSFVCSRLGRLTPPCLYALADLLHPK
jgi:hypothetical protein